MPGGGLRAVGPSCVCCEGVGGIAILAICAVLIAERREGEGGGGGGGGERGRGRHYLLRLMFR